MQYRALTDESGRIRQTFGAVLLADLEDATAGETPAGWVVREAPAMLRADLHWWDGAAWALRPVPPAPPALAAGVETTWAGLQPGAVVTLVSGLSGQIAGTVTADTLGVARFALAAGPWRLYVAEAFPAVAASFTVEVAP